MSSKVNPAKFVRKPFHVEAIQVTEKNMEDISTWCKGRIEKLSVPNEPKYIKVRVTRPQSDRQTQAFIGDWVVFANNSFKVYTDGAFKNTFVEAFTHKPGDPKPVDGWVIDSDGGRKIEIHEDHDYGSVLDNAHLIGPNCD